MFDDDDVIAPQDREAEPAEAIDQRRNIAAVSEDIASGPNRCRLRVVREFDNLDAADESRRDGGAWVRSARFLKRDDIERVA
jgi:hypothetical protein